MSKVSVIIPVYNVAEYLRDTLNSVVRQSLEDIEIICIDDCSTDGSREILKEYSAKDERIKLILHDKNLSTSQSRKDGVLASKGKYVMFLDGDDLYYVDTCLTAYETIEKYGTDMVHFNCHVEGVQNLKKQRIIDTEKAANAYLGRITADSLIKSCWIEKKFGHELWNKIFNGEICRKAFMSVMDGNYPRAQDLYAFFVLSYFAKSYQGISDILYQYRLGSGITGGNYLNLKQFKALTLQKDIIDAISNFTIEQHIYDLEIIQKILNSINTRFLNSTIWQWIYNVQPENKTECYKMLLEKWSAKEILQTLIKKFWDKKKLLAEHFTSISTFSPQDFSQCSNSKYTTIGIYYFKMCDGGAEKISVILANLFANRKSSDGEYKYKVVLISDEEPNEKDYFIDKKVKREYLPSFTSSIRENYIERFAAWQKVIEKNQIDVVISGLWVSPVTFWDILSVKLSTKKPLYIMQQHNFSCIPYQNLITDSFEVANDYRLCDRIVVLSQADEVYVRAYNRNTELIANPTDIDKNIQQSTYEDFTIIWVGRISYEKKPLTVVQMMKQVVANCPQAKLYMIGDGDVTLVQQIKRYIQKNNLSGNVQLVGFTKNVEKYYRIAVVMVSTSDYEGWPTVYREALAFGVPIVAFELPWLFFTQNGQGVITVPQNRSDLMAKEVVTLLLDKQKVKSLGDQGRALSRAIDNEHILKKWEEVIFSKINYQSTGNDDISLIVRYINQYNEIGKKEELKHITDPYLNQVRQKQKKLLDLHNSRSFKIGRLITWFPRKIRDILFQS